MSYSSASGGVTFRTRSVCLSVSIFRARQLVAGTDNCLSNYCLKGGGQIAESRENLTIIMLTPYGKYIFGVGVEQFSYIIDKVIRIPDSTFITS